MAEHLGFSPDILRRLGEELVPYADQGLLELVRNAYDADAKTCTIRLQDTTKVGGSIFVSDDGSGIDRQSITNGWLVIGRSHKRRSQRTAQDRIPAGDKGLGRLAGLRLGTSALLHSRPASEPGVQYEVLLNWQDFDNARLIEDVVVKVVKSKTTEQPGTTIELRDVRAAFTRANVTRLARSLVLLSDPFEHSAGFRPVLLAPEFSDLESRVSQSYFDEVEYRITGAIDETGRGHAEVLDYKGQRRFQADHARLAKKRKSKPYNSPAAKLELWAFNMGGTGFATRTATKGELSEWIKVVGGVHVYQHNLRVPPYGDAGEDWLDMNLRRARNPEFRPSTNTSVGRVVVESQDDRLVQKTDRSGFLENEPFIDLRQFCRDVLDWSATEHLRVAENKRRDDRKRAENDTKASTSDAEQVRKTLSESTDPNAKAAFDRYQKALDRQLEALREDVLLYRTLGTVGTTSSAFAHESIKPASRIEQGVKLTRSAGVKSFGNEFTAVTGKQLDAIEKAAIALGKWAQLPLQLLRRDKRRQQRVDLRLAIRDVTDLLEPFMDEAKISLTVDFPAIELAVFAPPAAVESIIANLLINSIHSVVSGPKRLRQVRVTLEPVRGGQYAALVVSDSGTGIEGIDLDELWLPGRTTRDQGTGLGLTIVKDSTFDLGGSVGAIANGALGGADFTVELPLVDTI